MRLLTAAVSVSLFAIPAMADCRDDWICVDTIRAGNEVELHARNLRDYPITFTLRDLAHKTLGIAGTRALIFTAAAVNIIMAVAFAYYRYMRRSWAQQRFLRRHFIYNERDVDAEDA